MAGRARMKTWVVWYVALVGWVYGCGNKVEALVVANAEYGERNYADIRNDSNHMRVGKERLVKK